MQKAIGAVKVKSYLTTTAVLETAGVTAAITTGEDLFLFASTYTAAVLGSTALYSAWNQEVNGYPSSTLFVKTKDN